jgi:hypothetical protein
MLASEPPDPMTAAARPSPLSLEDTCRRGLAACSAGDRAGVRAMLLRLTAALDFQYREAALGLVALYNECLERAEGGDVDPARRLFAGVLASVAPVAEP